MFPSRLLGGIFHDSNVARLTVFGISDFVPKNLDDPATTARFLIFRYPREQVSHTTPPDIVITIAHMGENTSWSVSEGHHEK